MAEYRSGAENVPIKNFEETKILVLIIDLKNDDSVVDTKLLDYGKVEDRKYLGRLTYWAVCNNHSIETMAYKDAAPEFIKPE